jgi:hypothetical protein
MKRALASLASLGAASVTLLIAAPSQAQEWRPLHDRSQAGADIYLWSARGFGTSVPIVGFFNFGLTDDIYLDVEAPFSSHFDGDATAAGGNPWIGVHWADDLSKMVTLHLGGGAGVPIASIDEADWRRANARALFALALHDSHLWVSSFVPLYGDFGVEIDPTDWMYIRASLEPIFLVPIDVGRRGQFRGDEPEFVLQNTFEWEARHPDIGIGGGVAILPVWVPTEGGDNAQISAEPFFGYDNGTFFMRAGVRLALDRPLGFAFDRGRVATIHARVGGQW